MRSFLEKYNIVPPTWGKHGTWVTSPHLWSKEEFAGVVQDFKHSCGDTCCLRNRAVIDFLWDILEESLADQSEYIYDCMRE